MDFNDFISIPPIELHPAEWALVIFVATCLLVQLVYILFIFARLAFYKSEPRSLPTRHTPVSVIVAAHNEEENLKKLLPALLDQDYPAFEVIIADDRSHDESWQVLYETRLQDPRLRVVNIFDKPDGMNGKKFALTLAIKAAKYDLLLLTDADCLPVSRSWISDMVSKFTPDTQFVLGYSQYEERPGLLNSFIRFETLYTALQYLSLALAGKPYMGVGRNLAYRKSMFMEANGFYKHTTVTGGDDDLLVNRLATDDNTTIAVGESCNTISIPKTTLKDWYRQKKRHLSVGKFYKFSDRLVLGILAASHVLYWVGGIILCIVSAARDLQIVLFCVLLGFLIRWISLAAVLAGVRRRLGDSIHLALLPLLDFLYIIYYIVIGFAAATSKKVRWK